jgi:hypothetical protein
MLWFLIYKLKRCNSILWNIWTRASLIFSSCYGSCQYTVWKYIYFYSVLNHRLVQIDSQTSTDGVQCSVYIRPICLILQYLVRAVAKKLKQGGGGVVSQLSTPFQSLINLSFPKIVGTYNLEGYNIFGTYHFSLTFELMYRNLLNFSVIFS